MRNIVPCNDLLKYASLRAEPDYRYVFTKVIFFRDMMCRYLIDNDTIMEPIFMLTGPILMRSGLGKKLGKSMGLVAKEVKALTQAQILEFQKAGEGMFAGHKLGLQDIKVNPCSTCEMWITL